MSEDRESVVVATGPKVGSNWICNILCALRYYDKEGGGIRSPFSETQYIDLEREDSYKVIRENSEHKLWKTHSPFQAEFAAWSNVKFININRDLRDVLVSLNFFQMFLARNGQEDKRILDFTPEEYMLRLIEVGDFKKWMKIIASWTGDNFNAKISLRYEDLLKDIHGEISKLCEFLELPCTSYDITSAIESASFENHANGRSPGQEDQNSFYRKGISGDWKNYLTPDVIKSFVEDEGGAWNRLLVRLGYEATEHWFTTETAPVKSLMKDSPSSLKIGLVHHWPGFKNSELDIIKRISQILQRLGHQSWIISPLGEVLCEYQAGEHIDDRFDIEDYELDFVVYFHFLSPKVLDIFSYVVNWNPVDFILKDPVNQTTLDIKELKFRKLCFQSHDEILSAGCAQADALVSSFGTAEVPVITGSESILHPTCQKISNLEFPALDQFKVFYIGAQWERISNVDRHGSLLEMLDKTGHFKFFGVRNRGNKYLWENIDNYYGELPFDGGKSIALNSNMCGVSLVLHSPQHRSNDLVSSRIFQACAAKTVIIADDNPWIIDHFGDSVLTFEYRHLDNEWNFNRINDLLLWIKNNPTEALAKARRANQIFSDHFSLEIEVEHLVQHYWNKFSMTNISSKVVDRDQLIHII
ncbi:MAG: sulfotransferase domain-containing protein [Saprospiraceae bacterium]|nr:sulfotransferase domain-containing protein [Saprospiraceae bacterium]